MQNNNSFDDFINKNLFRDEEIEIESEHPEDDYFPNYGEVQFYPPEKPEDYKALWEDGLDDTVLNIMERTVVLYNFYRPNPHLVPEIKMQLAVRRALIEIVLSKYMHELTPVVGETEDEIDADDPEFWITKYQLLDLMGFVSIYMLRLYPLFLQLIADQYGGNQHGNPSQ